MMLRNYILFAFTICFFSFGLLQAEVTSDSVFVSDIVESNVIITESEADVAYRNENFAESIKLYEAQVAKGKLTNRESAQLYYNLGNAYFRDSQIAKSIVNYERALLLNPGDSDIRHNLRFAKTRIEDKIDSADNFFINKWISSIQNLYNANSWTIIGIGFFLLLIIAIGVYMVSSLISLRKISFYSGLVLLALVIIANVFAFKQKHKITNRSTGIVMSASVSIYTSPDAHSQELFRLHEGAKVNVKREEGRWIEIVIANGSVGWLQKKNVEII